MKINKLLTMIGLGGLNGAVPIAALAGLFKPENALMLAIAFMAGPGTILPTMFFALANLGQDPVEYFKQLDIEVWGADKAAEYMRPFMPK